jgi:opacity protein-like surface antigen
MIRDRLHRLSGLFLLAGIASGVSALVAPPAPVAAQSPDFLFREPRLSLTARAGMFLYRGSGQFFDLTRSQFTASDSDFLGTDWGIELGVAMNPRLDLVVGIDGGGFSTSHAYRDWQEVDGSDIVQSTRIKQGPSLQVGLKGYLLPRGEALGTFAWAPNRIAPYVGGGLGYTSFDVRQWGDFVYEDADGMWITYDDLSGDGGAALGFAMGGVDIALRNNVVLSAEARQQWSEGDLRGAFRMTDPLDLSGLRLTLGLVLRF